VPGLDAIQPGVTFRGTVGALGVRRASPIDPEHRALVLEPKAKHPNMGLAQLQNQLKRFPSWQ
jgi:hypothetical protein